MEKEKIFDLEIAYLGETEIDKISSLKNIDIINIISPSKKLISKLKKDDFFYKPLKISWIMDTPKDEESYLSSLKRNRRKRILKAFRECEKQGINILIEYPLKKNTFEEWLDLYETHLSEKEKGIIKINKDWINIKKDVVGILARKNNELMGGIIAKKIYEKDMLEIAYSAFNKDYSKLGINDYLNVKTISLAAESGFKCIKRGRDTNLYGYHLSTGLYLFKKSLGFKIIPAKEKLDILTKINNFNKFEDQIFFVSYNKKGFEGNLIIKNKETNTEEFEADFLEKLNVFLVENNKLIKLK
jgi:hypothetical protein